MKLSLRLLVAFAIIWFVWAGSRASVEWPQGKIDSTKPDQEAAAWVSDVAAKAKSMLYTDRIYCSSLYDAMAQILENDGRREKPIIGDTARLAAFHGGTLDFAIDSDKVGKYPGLGEAIDTAFERALTADTKPLDSAGRASSIKVCRALAYVFFVGGDQ